ncbi:helix-turn-helix domain-containing protein [Burkholderia cepacia]|uniref:helix-turn-helix domain-containing protein n=1 Tax=Burkholderia cepacia TaxID=292 RepID=UPI00158E4C4E|nr:helix-turn-helix transcriptional regulator [Burkholderia cepacia]MCA8057470.1 helix-turn-helix domain-containing protein [Burkholderia cepacia]MCA8133551.1 helix-turn-helix domain-containing protein [Burkholderia cepacia]MCA8161842.1 helix-turn-helix domain-containing protein [Burkholderia cepacia]
MAETQDKRLAKRVGRAIAKRREASELTQEDVAEHLGIGNEAISRIERGIVMPTVARLVELAAIFHCHAADLLTESSDRADDQARHLSRLLEKLSHQDRETVVEIVEKLAVRLAKR